MLVDTQAPKETKSRAVRQAERISALEAHIAHFEQAKRDYAAYTTLPLAVQILIEQSTVVDGLPLLRLEELIAHEIGDPEVNIYAVYIEPLIADGTLLLSTNRFVYPSSEHSELAERIIHLVRRGY